MTTFKTRLATFERQLAEAESAEAESALRDFAHSLSPEHAGMLRAALGEDTPGFDMGDEELEYLMLGGLSDESLALVLKIAAQHVLPGHMRPFEEWAQDFDAWPPGEAGPPPPTPEARALAALKVAIVNLNPR